LGASHQTGWTGLVAKCIQLYGFLDPKRAMEVGKGAAFHKGLAGALKNNKVLLGRVLNSVPAAFHPKEGQCRETDEACDSSDCPGCFL
jgi:hypothetical protein